MAAISSHDKAVYIAGWVTMLAMCVAVLLKVASKYRKIRKLQLDDYFFLLTMVIVIGYMLAISETVRFGMGVDPSQLSPATVESFQKALYGSQILYVPAVALPKIAAAVFVHNLSRDRMARKLGLAICFLTLAWLLAGVLATVFQCALPTPWDIISGTCIDWTRFWAVMTAFETLLDISQVALVVFLLWDLHLPLSLRIPILAAFACRLLLLPLNILRVIYLHGAYSANNFSSNSFSAAIVTELIVNVGVILNCLPFLKPVVEAMEHGFFSGDLRNIYGVDRIESARSSFAIGSSAASGQALKSKFTVYKQRPESGGDGPFAGYVASISTTTAPEPVMIRHGSPRSDTMIIYKSTDVRTESQPQPHETSSTHHLVE